jgi:hypothetical protein
MKGNLLRLACVSSIIFSASFLFAFVIGNIFIAPKFSAALLPISDAIPLDSGSSLSYTITQPEIDVNCGDSSPCAASTLFTSEQTVEVTTDNPTGYQVLVALTSDETCMRNETDFGNDTPCSSINTNKKFASVPNIQGGTATSSLPNNSWGMSQDYHQASTEPEKAASTWLALPTGSSGNAINLTDGDADAEGPVNDHVTTVTYGVKANPDNDTIAAGTYQNEVLYTVAANTTFGDESWSFDVTPSYQYIPSDGTYGSAFTIPTAHVNVDFFRLTQVSYQLWQYIFDCVVTNGDNTMPPCSNWDGNDFDMDTLFSTGFPYNWDIDWGDGSPIENASGVSTVDSVGITHAYPDSNTYTITIYPANATGAGWLNAFGSSNGALSNGYQNFIAGLPEPFPYGAFSIRQGALQGLFHNLTLDCPIPDNLFENFYSALDDATTLPADIFDGMFYATFSNSYVNSNIDPQDIVIPEGIFSGLNTSRGTSFNSTFFETFAFGGAFFTSNGQLSTTDLTVPENIFSGLDTSNAISMNSTFYSTFTDLSFENSTYTLPENIFASLDTNKVTSLATTFLGTFTFNYNMMSGKTVIVPDDLFASLDTSNVEDFTITFGSLVNHGSWGYINSGYVETIVSDGIFSGLNTSNGKKFYGTFASPFPNMTTIPPNLFANLDTSNGEDFTGMFFYITGNPNSSFGTTIPAGLLDNLDTHNGTKFYGMFYYSFLQPISIPAGLFNKLDTSQAEEYGTNYIFYYTFYNYMSSTTGNINDIFDGADLSGITTDIEKCTALYYTFYTYTPYLTGNATQFLSDHLADPTPSPLCYSTYTFRNQTTLTDYSTLDPFWK